MRRSTLCALFALAAATAAASAQASDTSAVEFEKIRTPTSPAFTLLGVNPSTIARPTTPRALATEFVSSTNRGTVIPNNYAVEFAPYWLTPKPGLTYKPDTTLHAWQNIRESFSVSVASARPDSAADSLLTLMAVGFRAAPLAGSPTDSFMRFDSLMTRLQSKHLDTRRLYRNSTSAADSSKFAKVLDAEVDTLKALARKMAAEEPVGWFLDLATAVAVAYPDGTFDSGKFSRAGGWSTLTYRTDSPRVDFIGLLRYMRNLTADEQNALDLGSRLHWSRGDLGISSELVNRTTFKVASTTSPVGAGERTLTLTSSSRAVGIVDYRAADDLYFTISFGKDHKPLGATRSPLVASLGMQLSYGKKPVLPVN